MARLRHIVLNEFVIEQYQNFWDQMRKIPQLATIAANQDMDTFMRLIGAERAKEVMDFANNKGWNIVASDIGKRLGIQKSGQWMPERRAVGGGPDY